MTKVIVALSNFANAPKNGGEKEDRGFAFYV